MNATDILGVLYILCWAVISIAGTGLLMTIFEGVKVDKK